MNNRIFFDDEDEAPRIKQRIKRQRFDDLEEKPYRKKKADKKKRPHFNRFDDSGWNTPERKNRGWK